MLKHWVRRYVPRLAWFLLYDGMVARASKASIATAGKTVTTAVALIAAALCCVPARSQPYATAELGYSSADFSLGAPYNGAVDDRSMVLGVDVGFGFSRHLALEIGGRWYGDFDGLGTPCGAGQVCPLVITTISGTDISTYKLSLVPHITVGRVEVFGEAGYYRMRIDAELNLPDDDFKQRGLVLGAGARWYFAEPWSISIRGSRYDSNLHELVVGVGWGLSSLGDELSRRERRPR